MARRQTTGHARTTGKGFTASGMGMSLKWRVSPTTMASSYAGWWQYTRLRLSTALRQVGDQAVVFMRMAHPWTNRTGDAEAGLRAEVSDNGNTLTLVLSHSVYYGVYLENRWGGKWGVLPMTVERFANQAMTAMQGVLT
jgi:hypothetical protein